MLFKKFISTLLLQIFTLTTIGPGYLFALRPPGKILPLNGEGFLEEKKKKAEPLKENSSKSWQQLLSALALEKHPFVQLHLLSVLIKLNPEEKYLEEKFNSVLQDTLNFLLELTTDRDGHLRQREGYREELEKNKRYLINLLSEIFSPLLSKETKKNIVDSMIKLGEDGKTCLRPGIVATMGKLFPKMSEDLKEFSLEEIFNMTNIYSDSHYEVIRMIGEIYFCLPPNLKIQAYQTLVKFEKNNITAETIEETLIKIFPLMPDELQKDALNKLIEIGKNKISQLKIIDSPDLKEILAERSIFDKLIKTIQKEEEFVQLESIGAITTIPGLRDKFKQLRESAADFIEIKLNDENGGGSHYINDAQVILSIPSLSEPKKKSIFEALLKFNERNGHMFSLDITEIIGQAFPNFSQELQETALEELLKLSRDANAVSFMRKEAYVTITQVYEYLSDRLKETALNTLLAISADKKDSLEARMEANKTVCKILSHLPNRLQQSTFAFLIEFSGDPNWDLRLEAHKTLSNLMATDASIFAQIKNTNKDFFQFYQDKNFHNYLETINNSLPKNKRINLDLYLDRSLPLFFGLFTFFAEEPEQMMIIVKDILEKRGFLELYRFLEVCKKLNKRDKIMLYKDIFTDGKQLAPLDFPKQANLSYWLGRSLIVPLGHNLIQVFKYERNGDSKSLKHELKMIETLKQELSLPILEAGIINDEGRTVLVYIAETAYFDYIGNSYPWLSKEERIQRLTLMSERIFNHLFKLFKRKKGVESLLYLSHYILRGEKANLDLRHTNVKGGEISVGEIDNPHLALQFANLGIIGTRDWEHIMELDNDKPILNNLFESNTALVYSGLVNDLENEEIRKVITKKLSNHLPSVDMNFLSQFIRQFRLDLKDPGDVFYFQYTHILPQLERLTAYIWENFALKFSTAVKELSPIEGKPRKTSSANVNIVALLLALFSFSRQNIFENFTSAQPDKNPKHEGKTDKFLSPMKFTRQILRSI